MDQKNLRPTSYIGLINRFWRLDETYQFSPTETRVFFYLLKVANTLGWPESFPHADSRAAATCGVSLPVYKAARKALADAGLILHTPGGSGHGKKTMYHFAGCDNCQESDRAKCQVQCHSKAEKSHENESKNTDLGERKQLPKSEPYINIKTRLNENQIRSESEEREKVVTEKIETQKPDDGTQRNTEGLLRNLRSLHASQEDIQSLLNLSNHGEIGHPIWKLIYEAKNSNGAIKQPVRFIFSRLLPSANAVTN